MTSGPPPRRQPISRRDRRGRGIRGPLAWPPVPAMLTRSEYFDDVVMDAAERLERHWSARLPGLEFAVEDVPPPVEPWSVEQVPLGRAFGPERGRPARIVIYRRPLETRAVNRRDVAELVGDIVTEQIAALLGVPPEEIDPTYPA